MARRGSVIQAAVARYRGDAKFADYLRDTFIPDLRDSGREATADDFVAVARILSGRGWTGVRKREVPGGWARTSAGCVDFVRYLRQVGHDYRQSGYTETAKDYTTAARMILRRCPVGRR